MSFKSLQHHNLITALLLLLLLAAVMLPTAMAQKNSCHNHHCYNGGTVLMPATVFSNCRCKCAPNFTGPQCRIRSATLHPPTTAATTRGTGAVTARLTTSLPASNKHHRWITVDEQLSQ